MMWRLMLLFEQKAGLFDSVDQYPCPGCIISAWVEGNDQAAIFIVEKIQLLLRLSESRGEDKKGRYSKF